MDWNNYDTGPKSSAPPQAKGADGRYIQYFAQLPNSIPEEAFKKTQAGNLMVTLDPVTLVNNGAGVDGYKVRFARASAKKYTNRDGKEIEASQMGNLLMATGAAKSLNPQTEDQYKAAVQASAGAIIPVFLEWSAYDNQAKVEVVSKYDQFEGAPGAKSPVVPAPDGQRKLVARAEIKSFLIPRA